MPLRPIMPPKDFDVLAEIMLESFQYPENEAWGVLPDERESFQEQVKSLKQLWPVLRGLSLMYPKIKRVISGYIYEEMRSYGPEPAGVVLYNPTSMLGGDEAWTIGTVGVLPAFRRRGIARKLVEAALTDLRRRGAQTVQLDVFAQNTPAYQLYVALGFTHYATSLSYLRPADAPPIEVPSLPAGYRVESLAEENWQPRYELALRTTPEIVQRYEPVSEDNYRSPPAIRVFTQVLNRLSGVTNESLHVLTSAGESVAIGGYAGRTRPGGSTGMGVRIAAEHVDAIAPYLLARLLHDLTTLSPGRRVSFSVKASDEAVIDAAVAMGFELRNEWHDLGMTL